MLLVVSSLHCVFFPRWWAEELSESCAKPNGKAKMLPSRPSRANQKGMLLLSRYDLLRMKVLPLRSVDLDGILG